MNAEGPSPSRPFVTGIEMGRVAEVIVETEDLVGRRGSGYLIRDALVLTAAHVVEESTSLMVRFDADRPGEHAFEAKTVWYDTGIDVAVLRITRLSAAPTGDGTQRASEAGPLRDEARTPIRFACVPERDAVLDCSAVGFPLFKLRTHADGTRYRDACHVAGQCAVLSNRREGTLDVRVASPDRDPDPAHSPWEGMSGAAVFAAGMVVGVVALHHRSDGPRHLAAVRTDRWHENVEGTRLAQLEALLGVSLAPGTLPDVWNELLPAPGSALTAPVSLERPPGDLLAALPPDYGLELEIHPSIAGTTGRRLPVLTEYIARAHDTELRGIVEQAAAGQSGIAVLVGATSTGKTRACWEALQALPPGWRLWHPISPARAQALSDGLDAVAPRTVIWLNEAQRYLNTPGRDLGGQIASRLRGLLRDPGRGPVLVLGTLWPEYHADLTHGPAGDPADHRAPARDLLSGRTIAVPSTFSGTALSGIRTTAARDERLQEAVRCAEDGQITQYLAGVPAVLDRYRMAPPEVRAVIEAAMDLRRLDCGPALDAAILEDAAAGYMTERQWDELPDGWFVRALAYATESESCRGARSPLYRTRARVDRRAAAGGRPLMLSDAVEQFGRISRGGLAVAETVWQAALVHSNDDLRTALAAAAEERGLLRIALELLAGPARAGSAQAWSAAARLLGATGKLPVALACFEKAADAGETIALRDAGDLLRSHRPKLALELYLRACEAGDTIAVLKAADLLLRAERIDEARALVRADTFHHRRLLTAWYDQHGRPDDAEEVLREAAQLGLAQATAELAERALGRDDTQQAEVLLRTAVADGAPCEEILAELLHNRGELTEAINWYQRAAKNDSLFPTQRVETVVVQLLAEAGRADEIEGVLREYAESHNYEAVTAYVEFLEQNGRTDEAYDWLQERFDPRRPALLWEAVRLLERLGREEEAAEWLRRAAEAGDRDAGSCPARPLVDAGRLDEAIAWMHSWAESGAPYSCGPDLWLLEEAGRRDEALALLRQDALHGDVRTVSGAHVLLVRSGADAEALGWLKARAVRDRDTTAEIAHLSHRCGGDPSEVLDWFKRAAEMGDDNSWGWVAELAEAAGRLPETIAWAEPLAMAGNARACALVEKLYLEGGDGVNASAWCLRNKEAGLKAYPHYVLQRIGDEETKRRVQEYGIEPGGRVAEVWDAAEILGLSSDAIPSLDHGVSLRKRSV
ncbi:trypsin-like peptidase domain-containing protein [[Kitasatospora] papulosa]|uniref:trypsin-like peptidase domain-containing protein n=1 Tax=[Kitasatospora] papulosa TaxID=1464011 RepID=UPI0037D68615